NLSIPLSSSASDAGTLDTLSYAWTVTKNGSAYDSGTSATFNLLPNSVGSYVVTLTVTDKDGGVATDVKTILVGNLSPTTSIGGAPASSVEGSLIQLTASGNDPDSANALTYAWTVTKNGSAYTSGTGDTLDFTPDDNASYLVTLTATDSDGAIATDTATINVT